MNVILPITDQCNQNCLFCSAKGRKDRLGKRCFQRIINQAKDSLVISGGEPTLSPDLFWVIKEAKRKNLFIELQTNGTTLYYKDLSIKLVNLGVDLFNINFPSHVEQLCDQITQTKGFFIRRLEGISNLEKLNAGIRLTHNVNSLSYLYLSELVDFIKNKFKTIVYIQFSFIKILGNAKKNYWIVPRYEAVKEPLVKALKKCQRYKIDFLIDHMPVCLISEFKEHHADFIKLKSGQGSIFSLKEKVKIKQCKGCRLSDYCYGVRKDYLELFGQSNIKIAPLK